LYGRHHATSGFPALEQRIQPVTGTFVPKRPLLRRFATEMKPLPSCCSAEALGDAGYCQPSKSNSVRSRRARLNVGDPIEHIRKLGGKIPDARPSMLLDYNAGRRCEVDAINGAIPRLGKPLGVTTPVNDTLVGIIRARERRMLA
jgi:hypothetical protein